MYENLYHVIMAGGSGTRFWPVSRKNRPKQFLELVGTEAMLKQTAGRCAGCGPPDRVYVSAGEEHRGAVLAAMPGLPGGRFIGEPVARNTAPAVGLSAMTLYLADPEALAVFCPADHIYTDLEAFNAAIDKAVEAAASGDFLVTLGITPTRPETGYGYIEGGDPAATAGVRKVARFIEKPDLERAAEMTASGRHFWNSGVFVWRIQSILAAIGRHHRALAEGLTKIPKAARAALPEGPAADIFSLPGVKEAIAELFDSWRRRPMSSSCRAIRGGATLAPGTPSRSWGSRTGTGTS
jgi:mannose-1-phosphate guanylyltransferase